MPRALARRVPRRLARFLLAGALLLGALGLTTPAAAQDLLIPMDQSQNDHLKAYGLTYWILENGQTVDWLLNYRGGSFLTAHTPEIEQELRVRGVSFEVVSGSQTASILAEVKADDSNTSSVQLEKPPQIAVYAPDQTLPWDDAVLLALEYAEVPYEMVYDETVLQGELTQYDWLHLHHEDFTGQFGKFWGRYRNSPWYVEQVRRQRDLADRLGYEKVSGLKAEVAVRIREYVRQGGFLFAMCSGTNTLDIALAARETDIVPQPLDGDGVDPNALQELDYSETLAFEDFTPSFNPSEYRHADIDVTPPEQIQGPSTDYFTLFEFSAKWDPVPSMLTQNHVATIKGFMGQTTSFRKELVKPNVVILAEAPKRGAVRYLHGNFGQGTFTFYAGHDPEDYRHYVGDPHTDLSLHKNSPGYRLILNNILFPAAKKKKQKT